MKCKHYLGIFICLISFRAQAQLCFVQKECTEQTVFGGMNGVKLAVYGIANYECESVESRKMTMELTKINGPGSWDSLPTLMNFRLVLLDTAGGIQLVLALPDSITSTITALTIAFTKSFIIPVGMSTIALVADVSPLVENQENYYVRFNPSEGNLFWKANSNDSLKHTTLCPQSFLLSRKTNVIPEKVVITAVSSLIDTVSAQGKTISLGLFVIQTQRPIRVKKMTFWYYGVINPLDSNAFEIIDTITNTVLASSLSVMPIGNGNGLITVFPQNFIVQPGTNSVLDVRLRISCFGSSFTRSLHQQQFYLGLYTNRNTPPLRLIVETDNGDTLSDMDVDEKIMRSVMCTNMIQYPSKIWGISS